MRQREREKETRGKEWVGKAWRCHGNWELSADSMFFRSFPTHLPPPDSLPFPSQSIPLSIASPVLLLSFLPLFSSLPPSLPHPFHLSHPHLPASSLSPSLHQPHPGFVSPRPLLHLWLHFHSLALLFSSQFRFKPHLFKNKSPKEEMEEKNLTGLLKLCDERKRGEELSDWRTQR